MASPKPRRGTDLFGARPWEGFDRLILILAFFAGIGGTLAIKTFELSVLDIRAETMAAVWSALVLTTYVLICLVFARDRIEPEAVGDNAYYLGFLFTLASLAYSLRLLVSNLDQEEALRQIVSGFGVALSSTICGVFLRVLLVQMRSDMAAREMETRIALVDASRELRTVLEQSIAEMKSFAVESVQLAAERDGKVREYIEKLESDQAARAQVMGAKVADEFVKAAEEASGRLNEAILKSATTTSEALSGQVATLASNLDERVRTLEERSRKAWEALVEASDSLVAQPKALAESVGAVTAQVRETSEAIGNLRERVVADALLTAGAAETAIGRIDEQVRQSLERLAAEGSVPEVARQIERLASAVEKLNAADRRSIRQLLGFG